MYEGSSRARTASRTADSALAARATAVPCSPSAACPVHRAPQSTRPAAQVLPVPDAELNARSRARRASGDAPCSNGNLNKARHGAGENSTVPSACDECAARSEPEVAPTRASLRVPRSALKPRSNARRGGSGPSSWRSGDRFSLDRPPCVRLGTAPDIAAILQAGQQMLYAVVAHFRLMAEVERGIVRLQLLANSVQIIWRTRKRTGVATSSTWLHSRNRDRLLVNIHVNKPNYLGMVRLHSASENRRKRGATLVQAKATHLDRSGRITGRSKKNI